MMRARTAPWLVVCAPEWDIAARKRSLTYAQFLRVCSAGLRESHNVIITKEAREFSAPRFR